MFARIVSFDDRSRLALRFRTLSERLASIAAQPPRSTAQDTNKNRKHDTTMVANTRARIGQLPTHSNTYVYQHYILTHILPVGSWDDVSRYNFPLGCGCCATAACDRVSRAMLSGLASMRTTRRCRFWPKARLAPAGYGPMCVTPGRSRGLNRRRPRSSIRAIAA